MNKIVLFLAFVLSANLIYAQNDTKKDSVAENLDELTILKQAQTFTNKNGNIKVDVANTILNSVSNTMDLLSKIPTIQIAPDKESITILGKGSPLVYIDKQKVTIEDLNNLAVEEIKNIEIIRNPSSKYESEGRAVILISRKSSKKDGFKVTITENASFKRYFNNYLGAITNFKKNKFEFRLNANYNQLVQWESNANDFAIPAQNISSDYLVTVETPRPQYILGGGVFYKINEDDYLSFNVSNRYQGDSDRLISDSRYQQNALYNEIVTNNNSDEHRNFLNSFINYNTKFEKGFQLFTGFQYSDFKNDSENQIFNDINQSGAELKQNRNQDFKVNVASARIDLEKTFRDLVKWEAGLLFLSARANTNLAVMDYENSSNELEAYLHLEKNSAAYLQFSSTRKKWSYGAGLRIENTIIDGKSSESAATISKKYTNFFPKADLSYAIDSTKTLTFNYAKSISRPNYSSTNLNPTYINPYFIFSGNINLEPTITDEISFGFQHKENHFGITLYQSKNPSYYGFEYNDTANILTFKPVNFDKETGLNVVVSMPFKYKFWNTNVTLGGMFNDIQDRFAVSKNAKPYLYYFSDHTFTFKNDLTATLTGWGMTKRHEGIFDKNAYFITNLALMKSIGNSWVFTISCNDILNQMNFTEKFTVDGIRSDVNYFTDTREFAVSVKYSFGKIKGSSYQEKEVDENSGRIK